MTTPDHRIDLTIDALSVERAGTPIVAGLSMRLAPGDAVLLTGANGSGKTSVLRALAGFCRHDGTITYADAGTPLELAEAAGRHVHLLGHEQGLSRRATVGKTLSFWQRLLGEPHGPGTGGPGNGVQGNGGQGSRVREAMDRMGLADGPVWRLSAGQRQRLALARHLVAPRAVWLLDEPVTALDAAGRVLLHDICGEHRARGGIIISSSHGLFSLPDAMTLALSLPEAVT